MGSVQPPLTVIRHPTRGTNEPAVELSGVSIPPPPAPVPLAAKTPPGVMDFMGYAGAVLLFVSIVAFVAGYIFDVLSVFRDGFYAILVSVAFLIGVGIASRVRQVRF